MCAARAAEREKGIYYVDSGTSGGVWGLDRGYCLMIGGEKKIVDHLDPIFAALAPGLGNIERTAGRDGRDPRPERGYMYCGPCGAGHFVKMIHNGIEYGMMQAYAEGFAILKGATSAARPADERYDLDVADIAEVWRRGSVISSWLLDLTAIALADDPKLELSRAWSRISARAAGSDGGDRGGGAGDRVPRRALCALSFARRSRFADRLLSAMRKGFGGHIEAKGSLIMDVAAPGIAATTGRAPRPADPCAFVVFGAGGDLTKRLLLPAAR